MTEKDVADAKVGIEAGVDFFALSFVREASDVVELKSFLTTKVRRPRWSKIGTRVASQT